MRLWYIRYHKWDFSITSTVATRWVRVPQLERGGTPRRVTMNMRLATWYIMYPIPVAESRRRQDTRAESTPFLSELEWCVPWRFKVPSAPVVVSKTEIPPKTNVSLDAPSHFLTGCWWQPCHQNLDGIKPSMIQHDLAAAQCVACWWSGSSLRRASAWNYVANGAEIVEYSSASLIFSGKVRSQRRWLWTSLTGWQRRCIHRSYVPVQYRFPTELRYLDLNDELFWRSFGLYTGNPASERLTIGCEGIIWPVSRGIEGVWSR